MSKSKQRSRKAKVAVTEKLPEAAPVTRPPKVRTPGAGDYPFRCVRVRGVLCRTTDHMPAVQALAEIEAAKAAKSTPVA